MPPRYHFLLGIVGIACFFGSEVQFQTLLCVQVMTIKLPSTNDSKAYNVLTKHVHLTFQSFWLHICLPGFKKLVRIVPKINLTNIGTIKIQRM